MPLTLQENQALLRARTTAFETPVVEWTHADPSKGTVYVLNEGIDIEQYTVTFSGPPSTIPLSCTINTPRMTMRPILYDTESTETKDDISFIAKMCSNWPTMKNYASGELKAPDYAEKRVKFFDQWWQKGSPMSGMMAFDRITGDRVGIFNIGNSDIDGETAECATIISKEYSGDHYATEGMVAGLLFSEAAQPYKMRNGSEFKNLSFTAKRATLAIAQKFNLTEATETATSTATRYGTDARNMRTVIKEPVEKIKELLNNTRERNRLKIS